MFRASSHHNRRSVGAAAQRRVPVKIPQKGCLKVNVSFQAAFLKLNIEFAFEYGYGWASHHHIVAFRPANV